MPVKLQGGERMRNVSKRSKPDMPLISVVTVVFNGGGTLEDAIRSLLQQTYGNIEYIVIDGGSTDGSLDVLRNYDAQIDYWISERDEGIYDAMNKGMALASGEIVGFLNSDDFYADALVLERVARAFQDESVQACYADLVYVSQDNSRVIRYWKSKQFVKGDFAKGWCPAHPTFYARKSAIDRMGFFDTSFKLAADVEFMMRYLECGQIHAAYIPHVLVRMRVGGATNQSWENIIRQNKEIFAAMKKNAIRYSKMLFVGNKVVSRLWQFIVGRVRRNY
ncbi:MAG: glycosyltransferase family 2 protein [Pseudomonadota bacterium]